MIYWTIIQAEFLANRLGFDDPLLVESEEWTAGQAHEWRDAGERRWTDMVYDEVTHNFVAILGDGSEVVAVGVGETEHTAMLWALWKAFQPCSKWVWPARSFGR